MLSRYIRTTRMQNIKGVSSILAEQWPNKAGKGDDVTFLKRIFGISDSRT